MSNILDFKRSFDFKTIFDLTKTRAKSIFNLQTHFLNINKGESKIILKKKMCLFSKSKLFLVVSLRHKRRKLSFLFCQWFLNEGNFEVPLPKICQ